MALGLFYLRFAQLLESVALSLLPKVWRVISHYIFKYFFSPSLFFPSGLWWHIFYDSMGPEPLLFSSFFKSIFFPVFKICSFYSSVFQFADFLLSSLLCYYVFCFFAETRCFLGDAFNFFIVSSIYLFNCSLRHFHQIIPASLISFLAFTDWLFSFNLLSSLFLVWLVIFNWKLGILYIFIKMNRNYVL